MFCYVKLGSGFIIMLFSLCCLQQMGNCGPGSSVSIVSGYGLDNWVIEVQSPA
jgi:hypothetical protein